MGIWTVRGKERAGYTAGPSAEEFAGALPTAVVYDIN